VIKRWVLAGADHLACTAEKAKPLLKQALDIIVSGRFFQARDSAYDIALSAAIQRGTPMQVELLLKLCPAKEKWLTTICGQEADSHGDYDALSDALMKDECNVGEATSIACQIIDRASDGYLNSANSNPHSYLRMAVSNLRPHALAALLKRFPAVHFDIVCPWSPVAEPISLHIPDDESLLAAEVSALVFAGEDMVKRYHRRVRVALFQNLYPTLDLDLISIIDLFAARMPLSTTRLVKPTI